MRKSFGVVSNLHVYKQWRLDIKYIIGLVLITLLALGLRIHNVSKDELWYDEAYTAEITSNRYIDVLKLSQTDVHPPLYYLLIKTWTTLGRSETMYRIPSVFFGMLLIPLVYYLTVYLTRERNKGLAAALLVAVNPFLIMYSKEARSYSLLVFLSILAVLFLFESLKDKHYLRLTILLPLLFLTHYISLFLIAFIVAVIITNDKRAIMWFTPLLAIISAWVPIIMRSAKNVGVSWIPQFYWMRILESFQAFALGITSNSSQPAIPNNPFNVSNLVLSIVIFGLIFAMFVLYRPNSNHRLLLACAVIPIFSIAILGKFFHINFYIERYLIGYFSLLIIYLVAVIPTKSYPVFMIYSLICINISLNTKLAIPVYRDLAGSMPKGNIVMTNASEFINLKYYAPKIKLQEGNWASWGIIKNNDIINKKFAAEDFYLVNRGEISGFKPSYNIGDFYFYKWFVKQNI